MSMYENILETIGRTPMVRLSKINPNIFAKLEAFNPGGSVKDRIALSMIEDAEHRGLLKPGDTIVEPTSGNTGIGLAMVAAVKDYRLILTMPESMSGERRKILKAYGAELVLTPADKGMKGAVAEADLLAKKHGYFQPQQFANPANPEIHRKTTAQEILHDIDRVDFFVVGVGTGGTITGAGEVLKQKFKEMIVIAVEPEDSPVLSGGEAGPHKIQGIGAGFVPEILNTNIYDDIIRVKTESAQAAARLLAKKEGIFAGISSGANLHAAMLVADRHPGKNVVVVLPDTGERYLSTDLFEGE
ncbi:MAG: cysteine synthase A [Candidatus Latescibacteria bacterium]|nr:cysteine synthase A [Candidatus Latescibacterota bacterium]NIO29053.1 cysteine synthase A [Candidatus Latescibacterota bacterium]NIO56678.1 cysteine synthase A [Candidatus Latescibacterota bacterium]NIT02261.1 cysteine synthase A [Candidatus Latescibacterota bacterium]NIT39146.1 cysteine synthase A [Candidatus Latescibacterota bacterium]